MYKIKQFINQVNIKLFSFSLILAALAYFITARLWEDSLTYTNFDIADALPGFPVKPEPYEILLYLFSYIVIPVLAFVFYIILQQLAKLSFFKVLYRRFKKFKSLVYGLTNNRGKYIVLVGGLLAIIILIFFYDKLPANQFVTNYFQRQSIWHLIWLLFTKRLFLIRISLAISLATFLFFFFIKQPKSSWLAWLKKAWQSKRIRKIIPVFFVLVVVIIFHPNFPSEENYTNYILSPAHEILLGKPLLYETSSVYGVLIVYFTALVSSLLLPMTYQAFSLLLMAFYFLFYVGLYRVLRLWLGSTTHALLGTWLGVVFGYLLLVDPAITPFNFPGQTAIRQGFYMLTLFLLAQFCYHHKNFWRELTLLASAISLFWNIYTGVYITIATFVTFTAIELFNFENSIVARLKKTVVMGLRQLIYILVVFGLITIINYLVYGAWPNWLIPIRDISTFNTGYGRFPIPAVGLFIVHVVIYTSYLLWILFRYWQKKTVHPVVVFLTVYGIFSFIYYIGTSAWSYLNFISIPAVLLAMYAFFRFLKLGNKIFSERFMMSIFLGWMAFIGVLTIAKIPTVFAYRDYTNFQSFFLYDKDHDLLADANYIKKNFQDVRIPVFHHDDGRLLLMADKINSLNLQENNKPLYSLYDDFLVVYKRQLQGLKNQIRDNKPEYVFISNTPDARMKELEMFIKQDYVLDTSLKTLNIYKRNTDL